MPKAKKVYSSLLQEMYDELEKRPFYEKWWSAFQFFLMYTRGEARHFFFKSPKNIEAMDNIIAHIKDDIEFGYDLDMIYGKMMRGSYNNTPISESKDHFKQNNIDWEWYLNRNSGASIVKQIKKSFEIAKQRNFEKLYYFFDIHETILVPDYNNSEPLQFYPFAKEALGLITTHPMIVNIIFTCSHPEQIKRYNSFFKENDIIFDHFNENPEVCNTALGCFDKKPYMSVLFEDKAGFDATTDWEEIFEYFNNLKNI